MKIWQNYRHNKDQKWWQFQHQLENQLEVYVQKYQDNRNTIAQTKAQRQLPFMSQAVIYSPINLVGILPILFSGSGGEEVHQIVCMELGGSMTWI